MSPYGSRPIHSRIKLAVLRDPSIRNVAIQEELRSQGFQVSLLLVGSIRGDFDHSLALLEDEGLLGVTAVSRKRSCSVCSTEFVPSRSDAVFCSSRCRQAHYRKKRGQ